MLQEAVYTDVPDLKIVVFQWSAKHGDCQECGLPAAFYDRPYEPRSNARRLLCAVCAANSAAEGITIFRIVCCDYCKDDIYPTDMPHVWAASATGSLYCDGNGRGPHIPDNE